MTTQTEQELMEKPIKELEEEGKLADAIKQSTKTAHNQIHEAQA